MSQKEYRITIPVWVEADGCVFNDQKLVLCVKAEFRSEALAKVSKRLTDLCAEPSDEG